ncbi:MAG: glucosylceramidase [Bacilli bacterium]|nr:glucosylceramidase [Bacilli bacterium]
MLKIVFTNKDNLFKEIDSPFCNERADTIIKVNANIKYQRHLGFGGALTDAACISFNYLSPENKEKYLKLYFSKEGLNYNLLRYPLGSCDFSTHNYYYLNNEDIKTLNIECDKNRILMYKEIIRYQKDIIVFAVPWSPPAFMKTNGEMNHGGKLKEEYYPLYAEMLVKATNFLREQGLNIQVLNVQNEPLATQVWDSCIYTGQEEAKLISDYLIPNIKKYSKSRVFLGLFDHNRDVLISRMNDTFSKGNLKPEQIDYLCFHWYSQKDFEQLDYIHEHYPNFHLVMTEGCVELLLDKNHPVGDFSHAEKYIHQIINDLNHYTEGYIDWNLSLNMNGGPNHVGNYCEAPIMIDEKGDMKINYSYYAIAHFAKFISPGDCRIKCSSNNSDIEVVSYQNSQENLTIITYNKSDNPHVLVNPFNSDEKIKLLPHSIYTFVHKN